MITKTKRCLVLSSFWFALAIPQGWGADGLFAVFDTSRGSFTCQLDYTNAPLTVANFIRLAQPDEYGWIDLTTGQVRYDPYYDGIIFHRVIDGFMIQGGSPAGNGRDGPGYAFPDEFSPALRHSVTGTLSMANSGPNSNGSQFFVTLVPTPHLDDKHSVFGYVTEGLDVVLDIGRVDTDAGDRPLTNVVIQGLSIVTNGDAAAAFDISVQGVPTVQEQSTALARIGTNWVLQTPPQEAHEYVTYGSDDLIHWTPDQPQLFVHPTTETTLDISPLINEDGLHFFNLTDVRYLGPLPDLIGTPVTFTINEYGLLSILLNADGTGTWSTTIGGLPPNGTIENSAWILLSAYNGFVGLDFDTLVDMQFKMAFDTPVSGRMTGTIYALSPISVTGSFTIP